MIFLVLFACSENAMEDLTSSFEDTDILGQGLSITAYPSIQTNDDGSTRALPVRLDEVRFEDHPTLELYRPADLQGTVFGTLPMTASRASLPGTEGPVDATLLIDNPSALDDVLTATAEDGTFVTQVLPGPQRLVLVPEDPAFALQERELVVDEDTPPLSLEATPGASIWGQVRQLASPIAGARVHLELDGAEVSPIVHADDEGWYTLRAEPGTRVRVVSDGFGGGTLPELTSEPFVVPDSGQRLDLTFDGTRPSTLSARVRSPSNGIARNIPYRLTSVELTRYEDRAVVVQTGVTDANGSIVTRATPGSYTLEVQPDAETAWSSVRLEVDLRADVDLGNVALASFRGIAGRVLDPGGADVDGAHVECAERVGSSRRWSTSSGALGSWMLEAPEGDLDCVVRPPDSRDDLAGHRFSVSDLVDTYDIHMTAGRTLSGEVVFEGMPEPLAVVEVRDADGTLLSTDLTSASGIYTLRVQP